MKKWFKSGSPWIWMTGGAVSLSLVAVIGLLMLIGWRGLVYFWPHTIYEWHITENGKQEVVIGELYDDELVPSARIRAMGVELPANVDEVLTRYLVKTGNREFVSLDFRRML